nr:MAG TPA: hypothetical protein [Caudoviricetes sp.]
MCVLPDRPNPPPLRVFNWLNTSKRSVNRNEKESGI